jgi:hypothetical protein
MTPSALAEGEFLNDINWREKSHCGSGKFFYEKGNRQNFFETIGAGATVSELV